MRTSTSLGSSVNRRGLAGSRRLYQARDRSNIGQVPALERPKSRGNLLDCFSGRCPTTSCTSPNTVRRVVPKVNIVVIHLSPWEAHLAALGLHRRFGPARGGAIHPFSVPTKLRLRMASASLVVIAPALTDNVTDISGNNALDRLGWSVNLSPDGNALAISSPYLDQPSQCVLGYILPTWE
jgi:hypothetical protein